MSDSTEHRGVIFRIHPFRLRPCNRRKAGLIRQTAGAAAKQPP